MKFPVCRRIFDIYSQELLITCFNTHFATEKTLNNQGMIMETHSCIFSMSSTSSLLKFSLLIDGDAIYQTEAFEQPTIPDSETLPFSIYQIKLVGQLMNQINRRLRQTNQTTEMLLETQTRSS